MTNRNPTCTTAVIRPGLTWFAAAGRTTTFHATPQWARTDLNRVVLSAQTMWFQGRAEGTILWQCLATGDDLEAMLNLMIRRLRERGCSVTEKGLETGWFSVRHEGYPVVVHLGIGPRIAQARTSFGKLDDEAPLLAERLARYADLTGAAWQGTAGMSGCAAIRAHHEAKRSGGVPLWHWKVPSVDGMVGASYELHPRRNRRDLTAAERRRPFVHHFDIRAMYLAAAGVAMVGWSSPEHSGPREFDPGHAGYWQVRRDQLGNPSAQVVRPGSDPLVWLTTPVMTWLAEHGATPEVFDSWVSQRTGRYLRPWAERLTAARKALDPGSKLDAGVLDAVKDTYARTTGMMKRPGGRIFRPDWRDTIVDTARINLVRKIAATGLGPVLWNVDSVWFVHDQEQATGLGQLLGIPYDRNGEEIDQVGKFRHVQSLTVEQYLDKYEAVIGSRKP
jgi:hypothetical protein